MRAKYGKTDTNQSEIIKALREIPGVSVEPGHDDIFCGYKGTNYWYEIKNPEKVTKSGKEVKRKNSKTQEKQQKLHENWRGHYRIVWLLEQILEDMGITNTR